MGPPEVPAKLLFRQAVASPSGTSQEEPAGQATHIVRFTDRSTTELELSLRELCFTQEVELEIAGDHLGQGAVRELTRHLQNPGLVALRLCTSRPEDVGPSLGDEGLEVLAQALSSNCSLRSLTLNKCGFTRFGMEMLMTQLESNRSLLTLNLDANRIGRDGTSAVATCLMMNVSLTELSLDHNKIGHVGATALAEALVHNQSLAKLSLRHNHIGDIGATAFARTLQDFCVLTALHLDDNGISTLTGTLLAAALHSNTVLTALGIGQNVFALDCVRILGAALAQNRTLTSLDLGGRNPQLLGHGEALGQCFRNLLHSNSTLTRLVLNGLEIGHLGAGHLAAALKENSSLTSLEMTKCGIDEEWAALFADALEQNFVLTTLSIVPWPCEHQERINQLARLNQLPQLCLQLVGQPKEDETWVLSFLRISGVECLQLLIGKSFLTGHLQRAVEESLVDLGSRVRIMLPSGILVDSLPPDTLVTSLF